MVDSADNLEQLAISAYLAGRYDESDWAWTRAHRMRLAAGDLTGALRCAFWLAFRLVNEGDRVGGNGWIARIEGLLEDNPGGPADHARLAYLTGLRAVFEGDLATSAADLSRAGLLARRSQDTELAALAGLALGRVLIFRGEARRGVRLIDEAMLAVAVDSLSPIAVGDSYCTAIDASHDLFDVLRGQAWTDGLTRWCARRPGLVPFTGVCQVHRAEFLQLAGAWAEAMEQAGRARAHLAEPSRQPAYGAAVYQQGELYRLRGEPGPAESCYREASAAGRDPQPGLALLRLSQGRLTAAAQAIDRALSEVDDRIGRSRLLAAFTEIMLACGRVDDARAGTAELSAIAEALGSPLLDAVTDRARGAVLLTEHDARRALVPLRQAGDGFREIGTPYETARTCVLIGQARRELGDDEGARLEFDAARSVFERLGARPELARLDAATHPALTAREVQVLRLVAQGRTNRAIAAALGLSERTVDRHVSNILAKLGVASRTAATAAAHQAELL